MSKLLVVMFTASIVSLLSHPYECKNLPNYISVCHRNDPQLSRCVRDSVTKVKPFIANNGMTDLGIVSSEPIHAYNVFSSQPAGPSRSVMMTVGTIELLGCSNFIIRSLAIDMDERKIRVETYFPEIFVKGQYSASGTLIFFPVSGSGVLSANYTNTAAKVDMGWDLVTKDDNQVYMEAKTLKLDITVNSAKNVYFENIMTDDKTTSELINVIINYGIKNSDGFWNIVSAEITNGVEDRLGPVLLEQINNLLSKFTYDQLFPVL